MGRMAGFQTTEINHNNDCINQDDPQCLRLSQPTTATSLEEAGKSFILQPTDASAIAQQRNCGRAMIDNEAAHIQHAREWQRYVVEHDAAFEAQADELRFRHALAAHQPFVARHPEDIAFQTIAWQSRADKPCSRDQSPAIGPRTKATQERAIGQEHGSGTGTGKTATAGRQYLTRYYTLADLHPFDVEAQAGLTSNSGDVTPLTRTTIREAIHSVLNDLLLG